MHDNILSFVEKRSDGYALLVKHQKRDQARAGWVIAAAGVLLYACSEGWIDTTHPWRIAIGAGALVFYALNLVIDASNREFALHVIDWMEDIESKRVLAKEAR